MPALPVQLARRVLKACKGLKVKQGPLGRRPSRFVSASRRDEFERARHLQRQ